DRSVEENLDLFLRMRAGEFPNGAKTLRAKIDMASPNINLRDPAMYRILHMPHHQTRDARSIYLMYDFAHPIQDALEGITHSLCSLEYEIHRPLYDWVTEQCEFDPKPRQIEFARLNLTNTVMSKRYLRRLVEEGRVSGWDDPRMPTLCGMRRRGYTAAAIRDFLTRVGVAKADSTVDHRMLEHCVREELNLTAPRATAITEPLKLIITNWDEQTVGRGLHPPQQVCELVGGPGAPAADDVLPFSRELYIEKSDFSINPPPKFFRLKPDGEVRLRGAYIIQCESWDTDENGEVTCVYATYDPETRSGQCERKVKGTLHWLPVAEAVPATFRHFEPLILDETEGEGDFVDRLNPNSQVALQGFVEPALTAAKTGENFQFIRMGYYCPDLDSTPDKLIFNRTVALKDSFRIINNKE
ncbi:MAG: glutamine--tRNA ligase, partial [Clostridiales bacterium]|nr:glutamine--tRNA ligase [Clostridiales bacterium]